MKRELVCAKCKYEPIELTADEEDQICTKCKERRKVFRDALLPVVLNAALPAARETMTVKTENGFCEVYKDDFMRSLKSTFTFKLGT